MKVNSKLLEEKLAEHGFTVTSLAEQINVPVNVIHRMVSGQMSPSHYVVEEVNALLNLSFIEHMQIFPTTNLS